jgi:5-methylcytosine-specific restriction enzyme A
MSPSRARRPCQHPGCATLADEQWCEAHAVKAKQQQERWKGSSTSRGYGADWARVRNRWIHAHPLCAHCELAGRTEAAAEVDHVQGFNGLNDPRRLQGQLQSLCAACHHRKHANQS